MGAFLRGAVSSCCRRTCSLGGGFNFKLFTGAMILEGALVDVAADAATIAAPLGLVLSTNRAALPGAILGLCRPACCTPLFLSSNESNGTKVSIFSSCEELGSHSTSEELLGLRANWEVGRVEKEEASSGNSESDVKPPNSNMAMVVTGSVGEDDGSGFSMRGNDWNSKFEVGDGEREMNRQLWRERTRKKIPINREYSSNYFRMLAVLTVSVWSQRSRSPCSQPSSEERTPPPHPPHSHCRADDPTALCINTPLRHHVYMGCMLQQSEAMQSSLFFTFLPCPDAVALTQCSSRQTLCSCSGASSGWPAGRLGPLQPDPSPSCPDAVPVGMSGASDGGCTHTPTHKSWKCRAVPCDI